MSYLTDYNVLKDIYFNRSENEIDCLKASKVKNIQDGIGRQGRIDFSSQHVFLKRLQEALTYKPDNTIRRKSDQLITQSRISTKFLRLSMDVNMGNHINQAKQMNQEREQSRQSKAESIAGQCDDVQEEQELLESDDDSDMPFDKADEVSDHEQNENGGDQQQEGDTNFEMQVAGDRLRSYSIVVEPCQDNTSDKSIHRAEIEKESLFDSNPNLPTFGSSDYNSSSNIKSTRHSSFISPNAQNQLSQNSESTEKKIMILEQRLRQRTSEIKQMKSINMILAANEDRKLHRAETYLKSLNECQSQASTQFTIKKNSGRKLLRNKMKSMGHSSKSSVQTNVQVNQNHLSVQITPHTMSRRSFVDKLRGKVTSSRTPCKHHQI